MDGNLAVASPGKCLMWLLSRVYPETILRGDEMNNVATTAMKGAFRAVSAVRIAAVALPLPLLLLPPMGAEGVCGMEDVPGG